MPPEVYHMYRVEPDGSYTYSNGPELLGTLVAVEVPLRPPTTMREILEDLFPEDQGDEWTDWA